jgi:hypothetical protein
MKIQNYSPISAFWGINFVFEYLKENNFDSLFNQTLPFLKNQSKYKWSDIISSALSIYRCNGDCIEDLQTHLKDNFINNPYVNLPSPDTVLRCLPGLF